MSARKRRRGSEPAPHEKTPFAAAIELGIEHMTSGDVSNDRESDDIVRGYRQMTVLNRIDHILDSTPSLDELLETISKVCAEHLSVRGCVLRYVDPETGKLLVGGSCGVAPGVLEETESERVVRGGGPSAFSTGGVRGAEDSGGPGFDHALVAPLTTGGEIVGTLEVFDRLSPFHADPLPFDESEVEFVTTVGTHIAHAIGNARLLRDAEKLAFENELRLRELSLLFEITTILRSSLDLEEMLYMILTCVTIGQGLGFNRALLFLVDEEREFLLGKMGVGPLHPEEAEDYWDMVDTAGASLAEMVREYGKFNMRAGFEVDRLVKEVAIHVPNDPGVLARTVREKKSFREEDYAAPGGSAERAFFEALALSSFAAVPLVARDTVVGAIVVDNLVTREFITDENLTFLMLFANQAASAIEMARAYKDLEMSHKQLTDARDMLVRNRTLATLGEFSAGIAHELRNPLVSIGGFARRLIRALPADSDARNYARIVSTEVEGLEQILGQILEFVAGAKPQKSKVDMNILVEHVLQLFREDIEKASLKVDTGLDEAARYLVVDEVQMRQLFINLVKNAVEAMPEGGELKIRSAFMEDEDVGVGFEVGDTGHGIEPEDMEKVFTPFFTRKDKGIGLGLSMCSRIVEGNHGGRMFIDSKKGRGTSVLVWFPPSALPAGEE